MGLKVVGATKASLISCAEPLASIIAVVLWLKTPLTLEDLVGMTCIILTVVLLSLPKNKLKNTWTELSALFICHSLWYNRVNKNKGVDCMSISHYSYKYGHGSKEFSLESDRVIKEVTVAKMPLLEDVKAAILDAVYHPIGSAPINELVKPGQKIAFICNDPTRVANSFVFMPILVNEMNKLGIKDEDMHIVLH